MRYIALVLFSLTAAIAMCGEPNAQHSPLHRRVEPIERGEIKLIAPMSTEKLKAGEVVQYRLVVSSAEPSAKNLEGKHVTTRITVFLRHAKTKKRILSRHNDAIKIVGQPSTIEVTGELLSEGIEGDYELVAIVSGAVEDDIPTVLDVAQTSFCISP